MDTGMLNLEMDTHNFSLPYFIKISNDRGLECHYLQYLPQAWHQMHLFTCSTLLAPTWCAL